MGRPLPRRVASGEVEPDLSSLAGKLAACYALLVVYASLNPFTGWRWPAASPFAFLWAPLPRYIGRADLVINVLAYIPLGMLCTAVALRRCGPRLATFLGFLAAALLSGCLETLQSFLPVRDSSNLDFGCNAIGALAGAALLGWIGSFGSAVSAVVRLRAWLLVPGGTVDTGVALVFVWLVAQSNPSIPFLGAGIVDNPLRRPWNAAEGSGSLIDPANVGVALNLCSIALLVSTLARTRLIGLCLAMLVLAAGLGVKWLAASFMLKDVVEFDWQVADAPASLAVGAAGFVLFLALPLWLRTRTGAAVVLAGAIMSKLSANYSGLDTVTQLFNWPYGHLNNFTGLTLYLNELWPLMAIMYLVFR